MFIAGAVVQWLRDGLGLIRTAEEVNALAATVPDNGGVYLVPAFAGLGAPHWDPYARGTIVGITRGTTAGHIARAALEAIAFQSADLLDAMRADAGQPVAGAARGRRGLPQRPADAVPGRPARRAGRPPGRDRDDRPRGRVPRRAGRRVLEVGRRRSPSQRTVERRFEPTMDRARDASQWTRAWTARAGRAGARRAGRKGWEGRGLPNPRMNRADMLRRAGRPPRSRGTWSSSAAGRPGPASPSTPPPAATPCCSSSAATSASGTSSRSTKLVHGGVRYLRQGHVGLVLEALRERGRLRRNAPHLVHDLAFVLPCYSRWDKPFYGLGLTAYDLLAGRHRFGRSTVVSRGRGRCAGCRRSAADGLRGGVVYHDGQFDDARLLIHLVMTAADHGAIVLNYAPVDRPDPRSGGAVDGVVVRDAESGRASRAPRRGWW